MSSVYDFVADRLGGGEESLGDYRGKVLLIVNTASKCGFTPQFEGLEKLYADYHARGFEILGFPCDQFGHQEPGGADEIGAFCQKNYGVTFPMFDKIEVNGADAHPLYRHLKEVAPGILGTEGIKWNFTKFLINREGEVAKRYAPKDAPASLSKDIEALL